MRVQRFRSGVRQKDSIDPNSMGRYLHVVAFPGNHWLDHRSGSVWTNTRPTITSRVSQRGERAFQTKLNERRIVAGNHIKKTRKRFRQVKPDANSRAHPDEGAICDGEPQHKDKCSRKAAAVSLKQPAWNRAHFSSSPRYPSLISGHAMVLMSHLLTGDKRLGSVSACVIGAPIGPGLHKKIERINPSQGSPFFLYS